MSFNPFPRHGQSAKLTTAAAPHLTLALAFVGLALSLAPPARAGQSIPILLDGEFGEWGDVSPDASDPVGDAPAAAIDLQRLWIADDGHALYLRLEVGRETIWQNAVGADAGNDVRLYLDTDNSTATGIALDGVAGIDLEIRPSARRVYRHAATSLYVTLNRGGVDLRPTCSSDTFEIRIAYTRPEETTPQIPGPTVRLFVKDNEAGGADRLPDAGTVSYSLSAAVVPTPVPIPLDRVNASDIRILSTNVHNDTPATEPEPFQRILAALQPDIVNYQEIYNWSATESRDFVAAALPLPEGESWYAVQVADCATISRFPILEYSAVDGNLVCLIDLPDGPGPEPLPNLVVFNCHTPCCSNESGRDAEHDRIAATWRDLLAGAGPFSIGPNDAVAMVGDFNMVGYRRQLAVLLDGDIIDNETNGPDFSPGRARGSLVSAPLRHTHARSNFTWWSDLSSSFTPGKLDYTIFSDDVAALRQNFVLHTPEIPADVLAAHGLLSTDSEAADHLPMVADFDFTPPLPPATGESGWIVR